MKRYRWIKWIVLVGLVVCSLSCGDVHGGIGLGGGRVPPRAIRLLKSNHPIWRFAFGGENSLRPAPQNDLGEILKPLIPGALLVSRARTQNVWILASSGLILFLLVPGLALFYGALHQVASIARLLGQSFGAAGLISILWWMFGYSLVFGDGGNSILGDITKFAFLHNLHSAVTSSPSAFGGSPAVFCAYQLTFAIVTAVLIVTTTASRVKFPAVLLFVGFWMVLVYFPLAHMLVGGDGLMNGLCNPKARIRAIDFGGGTVIQIAAGWSALILFLMLGNRGDERISAAHEIGLLSPALRDSAPDEESVARRPCDGRIAPSPWSRRLILFFIGEAMVWIGWYGFNSGWAAVTQAAAQAFTSTTIAGLVAAFAWVTADQTSSGKASNFGAFAGIVAGLAAITPAAGFVSPTGAIIIGLCAGLIPGATRLFFRFWGRSDQTIEAVGVHLLGGLIGMFMAGILATPPEANPALASAVEVTRLNGLDKLLNSGGLWVEQLKAIVVTLSLSGSASALIAISLRAAQEAPAFRSLFHHPAAAHLK